MNRIKKFISYLFRYKIATIFFIIIQLIIYFTIFTALDIYNQALNRENDRINSQYKRNVVINLTSSAKSNVISGMQESVSTGNLILKGKLSVEFRERQSNVRAEMVLDANETLLYPLSWGYIPGTNDDTGNTPKVVLGRKNFNYAYEKNGKYYITLMNEEYEVVGVLGGNSDFWDYKIILNINYIADNMLKKVENEMINYEIYYSSNVEGKDSLISSYNKLYEECKKKDPMLVSDASFDTRKGENTIFETMTRQNIKVNMIVYLFCIASNILVSYFWIIMRKKEIAVRKAFGISNGRIALMLFKDLFAIMMTSLILFGLIYMFVCVLIPELYFNINIMDIFSLFAGMLIVTVLSLLYPAFSTLRLSTAEAVK